MNVPQLRFKEFSGEWATNKKLGSYLDFLQSGKSKEKLDDGEFLFYGSTGVIGYTNIPDYSGAYLLVARVGANAGSLYAVDGKFSVSDNTLMLKISEKNNFEFFKSLLEHFNINKLVFGSGQPLVTGGHLKEINVNVPTLPEQTKIANFLTTIDERINQLTRKKELITQYKQGVMQKIFSQQLRFKDDNGEDFGDWEEKEINDIAVLNPTSLELPESFIYIDLESVDKGILLQEKHILRVEAPSRAQRLLKPKDVLFQMVRPYQKNNLYFDKEGTYVASTGYAQLRAKDNPMFLYHLLHLDGFIAEVMNRCTGTSYPAINSSDLASITIQVPSLPEQTKIANFLTALDEKIQHITQQIDATKQYKQGLLQQMFV